MKLRLVSIRIKDKSNFISMQLQEVSRVHSTFYLSQKVKRKGQSRSIKKLHSQYIAGFIDGEGSFSVSVYRDETMKNKIFVRAEFSIELRADDREILERIQKTIGCGKIYDCNYERYGWYPHVKYKIGKMKEISEILIPFLERCPLQAKKAETFKYFKKIVKIRVNREHLTRKGVKKALILQAKIRALGKKHRSATARVRENRLLSGVGR